MFMNRVTSRCTARFRLGTTYFFNIYINDQAYVLLNTETCNYADDTLHASSESILDLMTKLENDYLLDIIWFENHYMKLNEEK